MTGIRLVLCAAFLAVSLHWLTASRPAQADIGVAIDVQAIEVNQRLSPGGRYTLPPMVVRNPGDATGHYEMGISYFEGQPEPRPPESWFQFSPVDFDLDPGASRRVEIEVRVAGGADAGEYLALIEARAAPTEGLARLGAATGTKVRFTVKPGSLLESWVLGTQHFAGDGTPWTYAIPLLLLLLLALWLLNRRFKLRLAVQRRRSEDE